MFFVKRGGLFKNLHFINNRYCYYYCCYYYYYYYYYYNQSVFRCDAQMISELEEKYFLYLQY